MARPRAIHAVGDVTKQSSPARQLVPPRADVISMRAIRTNAIRSRLSALLSVLLASLAGLCAIAGLMASNVLAADEPRPPLAIQFSLDRPIDAAAAPFVMATAGGLFGAGSAGGHDQHRQRIAGCDCARRGGHQRFRAGRHQRVDAVSRQGQAGRPEDQGGVRAVQQGALCHHRPQEPRRPRAD